ncbi:LysR family transcriptional regulator, partial [Burkholderia contaminans]|uniref:LysR family transcriptional regulator n=1 Tax=Burkholderia contaminans TaxID=488447 RepID=UPI0031105DED
MRRIHLPPLQTLRAFETAVRLQSFTRAADALALTQGAVSQHIRTLEAQLGYPLFTRERNGATPTHAAHALALQVRQGLSVRDRAGA